MWHGGLFPRVNAICSTRSLGGAKGHRRGTHLTGPTGFSHSVSCFTGLMGFSHGVSFFTGPMGSSHGVSCLACVSCQLSVLSCLIIPNPVACNVAITLSSLSNSGAH